MEAESLNAPKTEENGEYKFGEKKIRIRCPIPHGEYISRLWSRKCHSLAINEGGSTVQEAIDLYPVYTGPPSAYCSKINVPATY
jgi:DNA repair and recombination protein RAD54B